MGFFHNEAKATPAVARNRAPAPQKRGGRGGHIPIASMNQLGCTACPRNKDKDSRSPKMNPTGPNSSSIYVLHSAPLVEDDNADEYGKSPGSAVIVRKLRKLGVTPIQHSIVRCMLPEGRTREPLVEEVECCRGYVTSEIEQARPTVIVGVGDAVLAWANGLNNILNFRGSPMVIRVGRHVCWFVPVLFPNFAYKKENARGAKEYELILEQDLEVALQLTAKPVPTFYDKPYDRGINMITGSAPGDIVRLEDAFQEMLAEPEFGLDYETNALRPWGKDPKIWTAAIGTFDKTWAFPIDHPEGWGTDSRIKKVRGMWGEFLVQSRLKIAHNLPFEMEWTNFFYGDLPLRLTEWDDTMSMAHTLDARQGTKSLGVQTLMAFGFNVKEQSHIDTKRILDYPLPDVLRYNGMDSKWTHKLAQFLRPRIADNPRYQWEHDRKVRLAPTLVLSQAKGVPVDVPFAEKYLQELTERTKTIELKIQRCPEVVKYRHQFGTFSPTNTEHVLKLLRDVCKREEIAEEDWRTGTVRYTTEEDALAKIPEDEVPSAALTLQHRGLEKLKGTYLSPIATGRVVAPDGRIHTQYSAMVAVTGRLNSEDPNLQNIPIRTAEGRRIRHAIFAERDQWITALDYGQIEARVIGMASEDDNLCRYLWTAYDIHGFWADRFVKAYPKIKDHIVKQFKVDWDEKGRKTLRQEAKNGWVFPQFFGAHHSSCAKALHIPDDVAEDLAKEFWDEFRGVKRWQDQLIEGYYKKLYVETLTGRRRRGIMTKNELINHPVQGTAADIVTGAMCDLSELAFIEGDPELQPNLNIHDDLTNWIADASLDTKIPRIAKVMCRHRFPFMIVPINVEVKLGVRWDEMEEIAVYRSNDLYNMESPYK